MKLRARNTNSALLCWDPPSEKAGETIGYEIDWSIDHVKQDILNITQSHCHTISDLKPKAIIEAAIRANFNASQYVKRKYVGPFGEAVHLTMPEVQTGWLSLNFQMELWFN